ncbi:isocitrate dehydrogenase [Campylobacter fetus subsp. testudinum]|uniref:Isocitrate dehydrogenase [NADP] n=1 Tax=Campylobacter fetus subsp. testudinum TaxID=1507806 RepID=A0AAX0HCA2_CAMFE|nr:NADP-dependent isocitrate dehydrogenase [Campylobacter fetus]OCR89876.1 isocitrate dehydrogenase [Campylobacter fetus subsp. testudinum]OCR90969.1 isocitrate dehydrogenase [Campylobacter fetus subsp. testudinum]OCR96974.1 isocitrate dehydrogenase [Campylobacter fetus subsp. testudinum]OCS01243.1 isocitrate dehydrogenase, NADP-dependent [Campylobacter fetus subsp. testudinum]OCS02297.1 isocitrate dehydrogenase [Campylobacter fetus subsp. testudinum]
MADIIYTYTDEAPALATFSLFPVIKEFLNRANIDIQTVDISLSGRILANFGEYLTDDQKVPNYLEILGEMTKEKSANIIKLPNISASLPQLNAAIAELQSKGYAVPNYIENPTNDKEESIKARYAKVLGSAVNPVLREGNSDRRCAGAVKAYAKEFPHKNGAWDSSIKTRVTYMQDGDFYGNEKSIIAKNSCEFKIEFQNKFGETKLLKSGIKAGRGDIISATFMSVKKLDEFINSTVQDAKDSSLLYSVHLKATMMKVSDPVIFGHFVKVFFKEIFSEFESELKSAGVIANNGLKDLFSKIENLPIKDKILSKFQEIIQKNPDLAMVDSDKGITNLHVPSDVIIDASMPAMIRNSGKMWDKEGKTRDTLAVIPDRTYATIYEATIDDLKVNGALNPATIGSVSNVGLMAKKAEEYGSHDKTFIASESGKFILSSDSGEKMEFEVENGDIFRAMQAKDEAIKDWIKLAVSRAKATNAPAIFWLDNNRAHDANMIQIVTDELKKYDISNLDISIAEPTEAIKRSISIIRSGKDAISVTGNVLRDYLTDLFPILELGTSAKMLSIVPLLNGGGLFETGAGGSAPKIAGQLIEENHLRWDSLGEFLALGASLEHLANISGKKEAKVLADTLDKAIVSYLKNDNSPRKNVGENDNRGSHFYLSLYWADELSKSDLKDKFINIANALNENKNMIINELNGSQGHKVDVGGYYKFDDKLASDIMRPSKNFNNAIGK